MLATFNVPSSIVVGAGACMEVAAQLKRLSCVRVLLVTDEFLETRTQRRA